MATKRTRQKGAFLDRYELVGHYLQPVDRKTGRPRMIAGEDNETGQRVVIKEWPRDPKVMDDDLREVWRQEIRQLHRLAGYPGARNYIVMLRDSAEDAEGFYLVLSPGQRLPLQTILNSPRGPIWLKNPRQQRNRLRLWHDLRRIAAGLDILHTQGLLHRNLDTWAIFTAGGDEPDFQLSGFEWSLRLTGAAERLPPRTGKGKSDEPVIYSFLQDWQAFGALAASLLGVDIKALVTERRPKDVRGPVEHLIADERNLLLSLLRADPLKRLDGDVVDQRIGSILSSLESIVAHREAKLYLNCGLGPGSRLSRAVVAASDGSIDIGDVDSQFDFINADLAEGPLLIALRDEDTQSGRRYLLAGRALTYRLTGFRPGNRPEPTWDVAFCESVARQRPPHVAIIGQRDLSDTPLEILPSREAQRRFATLQGKTARWDRQIADAPVEDEGYEDAMRRYRALVLLQLLEALLIAAEIWPVTVVNQRMTNGGTVIHVKTRADQERDSLCEALGLVAPAARMRKTLTDDLTAVEHDWKLTEVGALGERDRETARWQFVEIQNEVGAEPIFIFEGSAPPPIGDALYLRESDYVGVDRLLRRRVNALSALREHTELLDMLADPRIGVRQTHDTLAEDEALLALDDSKRDALRELWGVLPVYLVQGPPGVGKTRLVRELVARLFREDGTTRLLITAQSHHSVDHLLDEVRRVLSDLDGEAPLSVRCRPKDHDAVPGPLDLREQSRTIVDRLARSNLAAGAPAQLRTRIADLKATFKQRGDADEEATARGHQADRAFEALLLRAANMVFASTNSADLERLIEERAQVDWTIIEEAGKATGVELISPLLLSHRRLMIGDHKQLPPYGADQIKKLLADPPKVAAALEIGRPLVSRPFREGGMEDVVDELRRDEDLITVCSEAASALMMFETMVEGELDGHRQSKPRRPIAKRLLHQHRMHPAIARLISASFYDNALLTDDDCKRRYREEPTPFLISQNGAHLPTSPIVIVDMPYVQSTIGRQQIEQLPRYHNPEEVDTVIDVLCHIQPDVSAHAKPSLAVLSPYLEQVRRLRNRINDDRTTRLAHLSGFDFAGEDDTPVGTVDSFQGDEADVVVISMVRNNHHTGIGALGFLSDPRRMNVLLSRARWKLVLVGSLEFFEKRFQPGVLVSRTDPLSFLREMLDTLSALGLEADEKGVQLATVVPAAKLVEAKS